MASKDLDIVLLDKGQTIREAILRIDASHAKIALIVDEVGALLGTVTDGDVRRGILAGKSLEDAVDNVMNVNPKRALIDEPRSSIFMRMRLENWRQMPVVDEAGRVVDLIAINQASAERENLVVLMAGGRGTRLSPLTNDRPKPLLHVGGKPILERILEGFVQAGFRKFAISLNYMGEMVEGHFGDGSTWGAEIIYLREDKPLGTAGALTLLPHKPELPIVVMNGDVLTKANLDDLLTNHQEEKAVATLGARRHDFEIPFGVVETDGHRLTRIVEKPVESFLVNAGLYVLEPVALDYIEPNVRYDMPSLLMRLVEAGQPVSVFPIREYWLDIGRPADFDRANGEFGVEFN